MFHKFHPFEQDNVTWLKAWDAWADGSVFQKTQFARWSGVEWWSVGSEASTPSFDKTTHFWSNFHCQYFCQSATDSVFSAKAR